MTGCISQGKPVTDKKVVALEDFETIEIYSQIADITLIQEDRDDISITLNTYENGPRLSIDQDHRSLEIQAKRKSKLINSISFYNSPTLKIYVPEDYQNDLSIDNSSGNITIRNIHLNNLILDLSSGNINGTEIGVEKFSVHSSSGNVVLDNLICNSLDTDLSSGELTLKHFVGEISGTSSSGDTHIFLDELNYPIQYNSSSGDVELTLNPDTIDAAFDLSCSSGDVDIRFSLDSYEESKKNAVIGILGEGDQLIDIHVSSGSITIRD